MKKGEKKNRCSACAERELRAFLPIAVPWTRHLPVLARDRCGLTLVEVIIAMLVLAISFSALLATFSMARKSTLFADQTMEMMHEIRQVIETIRTNKYDSAALSVGTHAFAGGNYVVSLNDAFANTKDIVVTLTRTEPVSGRTYSLSLNTSVSKALHK